MRGLRDTVLDRPAKESRYIHIDTLFSGDIDWDLVATHQRDMIQVMLSIQAGRVMRHPPVAQARHVQMSRPALPRLPRAWPGRAHPVLAALLLQYRGTPGHPCRDHQGRSLQRLPGLGVLLWPGDQKRRSRRAGQAAQIRQLGRPRRHAVQCRRPNARAFRHGRRRASGHTRLGCLPQPLHAPPYPALRPLSTRHGYHARTAHPQPLPFGLGL